MGYIGDYYEFEGVMDLITSTPEITYNWDEINTDDINDIQDIQLVGTNHNVIVLGFLEALSVADTMDPKMYGWCLKLLKANKASSLNRR